MQSPCLLCVTCNSIQSFKQLTNAKNVQKHPARLLPNIYIINILLLYHEEIKSSKQEKQI